MTVISPRLRIPGLVGRSPIASRAGADVVRRHRALPRPPTYVILCATVGVLNIVGLVMILSASSVAALSDYGSSWYFFDRQLIWAVGGVIAFVVASSFDYHVWRRAAPWLLGIAVVLLVVVLVPGVGIMVDGSRRWLGAGRSASSRARSRSSVLCWRPNRGGAPLTACTDDWRVAPGDWSCSVLLGDS